jgi:hypothetical protein
MTFARCEDARAELDRIFENIAYYLQVKAGDTLPGPEDVRKAHGTILKERDAEYKASNTYIEYVHAQKRSLERIALHARKGLEEWERKMQNECHENNVNALDSKNVSLFLTGSAAKLEFFEKSSDVDFLAILHTDDMSHVEDRRKQFAELKNHLTEAILSAELVAERDDVDVSGAPIAGGKTFLTSADIIRKKPEEELSWAASFRAQLLTEARCIHSASDCEAVVRIAHDQYAASLDLAEGLYPLLATRLLLSVSIGGVVGQAIKLRRPERPADAYDDSRVIKAVVSRDWSSAINLLTLHVFYWQTVAQEGGKERSAATITRALSASPLYQLCVECPTELTRLTEPAALEGLRQKMKQMDIRDEEIKKIIGRLATRSRSGEDDTPPQLQNGKPIRMKEYRGGSLQDLRDWLTVRREKENEPPLWASYLDAMELYRRIRNGKSLGPRDLHQLMGWSNRFGKVLETANAISRVIMKHDAAYQSQEEGELLSSYKKLIHCHAASRLLS